MTTSRQPKNPLEQPNPIAESIAAGREYRSRWGGVQIGLTGAGVRAVSTGLLLFHPHASSKERRQVKVFSALNGPYGFLFALAFLITPLIFLGLATISAEFLHPAVTIPLFGVAGLALWQVVALIVRRRTADLLETSAVWWPHRVTPSTHDPELDDILEQLDSLDSTPARQISEADYLDRWQQIYDQARLIRTQRIADQTEHPRLRR